METIAETLRDPARLAALERTGLLDSPPDESFDRLTRLVTRVLDVPMALVTLVDQNRQFFKSCVGLAEPWSESRETPLTHSFCQHAVASGTPFIVEDAREHPLVRDNLAIGDLGVIAYAGIPLRTREGAVLGTVCAIDSVPRRWSRDDLDALEAVAAAVVAEIELRAGRKAPNLETLERGALNIAAVARRTGVATDTLRKWEQRYAILEPERTSGGQRRYTERDIERVEWLKARLAEGYRIGEAAALLGRRSDAVAQSVPEHRDSILAAVVDGDLPTLATLLDQAFALHSLDTLLEEVIAPVLAEVGEGWERGDVSVAHEHLATEAIRARLTHLLADTRGGVRGVVVLACLPGERHDLGLLMLAILLRADGWQVVYLGADTPVEESVAVAEKLHADVLGLSAVMEDRVRELRQIRVPQATTLVIGGRGANAETARALGAKHVPEGLRNAVTAIRKLAA